MSSRRDGTAGRPEALEKISERIFALANSGVARFEFVREILKSLRDLSGSQTVECCLQHEGNHVHGTLSRMGAEQFRYELLDFPPCPFGADRVEGSPPLSCGKGASDVAHRGGESTLTIPLRAGSEVLGVLRLRRSGRRFGSASLRACEEVARSLAVALINQRVQSALHERVKELTCLYGISQAAERPGISLGEILQTVVELLPPAMQFPGIASARIVLDDEIFATAEYGDEGESFRAPMTVGGRERGFIEVSYALSRLGLHKGLLLREEMSLINTLARHLSLVVERKQAEEEKDLLQEQLRHADRLATLGQLAAGVAHELNEPLGAILGFAQLAQKEKNLPPRTGEDLEKIVASSLHAREVVRKLMLFARQTPPKKALISLTQLARDGLYFLESRCRKSAITLVKSLCDDVPLIRADQSQILQVLINLTVNAIQSMPDGGTLALGVHACGDWVSLTVEDSGIGMSDEVRKQIFTPFFTTKEGSQGTGLGLAVVQEIVASHRGLVKVESTPGRGTRFEVLLPVQGAENAEDDDDEST